MVKEKNKQSKQKEKYINQKNWKTNIFLLIIAFSVFVSYINVFRAGFVDWDDNSYVTENKRVLQGLTFENIKWSFTNLTLGFYYPLTWLSHLADVSLYGLKPWGHHLTSLIIHLLNVFLLFALLKKGGLEETKSFFISLIFAVHPLNVESVAWISERKNILAAFFIFIGIYFYIEYLNNNKTSNYFKTVLSYIAGLMAKPIVVIFPFNLILIEILSEKESFTIVKTLRERWKKYLNNKIVMIAVIPIFTYLTIIAQKRIAALGNTTAFPFEQRLANAIFSYLRYIYQFLFPTKLTAFYPHLRDNYSNSMLALNIALLMGIFLATLFLWKRQKIYLIGFSWFFINLLPVIGIIQVGSQGSADRYMYIPMLGLIVILVFGIFAIFEKIKTGSKYAVYVLAIIAILFGIKTFKQSEVWLNSENLFANMIKESSNPSQGYINMGLLYKLKENYYMEAEYSKKAIEADRKSYSAYNNLGDALLHLGDIEGAKESFQKADMLNPDHPVTLGNLGYAEELSGNIEKAKEFYKKALEKNKYYRIVRIKLIYLLQKENNIDEAIKQCDIGDAISPDEPDFLRLKCAFLLTPQMYDKAKIAAEEGIRRFPEEKQFLLALGEASLNLGKLDEAERAFEKIIDSPLNNGIVYERLAEIKLRRNQISEAKDYIEKALKMDPSNKLYKNLMSQILQYMEENKTYGSK